MRFIETRTHGYLDYIMGILLIASPWIFDFAMGGAETWIPVILGAGMIVLALFTDYELGAIRKISMRMHLTIDLISGALLAVSPWLFGFADDVWEPHLIPGVFEIGASLMTKLHPTNERVTQHHHSSPTH
jgi:hypothetical protein